MMGEELPLRETLQQQADQLGETIRQTNGMGSGSRRATDSTRASQNSENSENSNNNDVSRKKGGHANDKDKDDEGSKKRKRIAKSRIPKKMKTSEILDPEDWPLGYSAARVDGLTTTDALAIRTLQSAREMEEKEFMPGRGSSIKDHVIKLLKFSAPNEDDCRKILHPARWLRAPLEHPREYWDKIPIKRKDVIRNLNLAIFGCEQQVSNATIAALHDRGRKGIKMCHFLPRNHNVEVSTICLLLGMTNVKI